MLYRRLKDLILSFFVVLVLTACGGSSSSDNNNEPSSGKTPIARDDSVATSSGSPVKITVLANDEGFGKSPFRVEIVKAPVKGAASVNDSSDVVTYTPKSGTTGSDSFQYVFFDSSGTRSNQAQVNITINSTGTKPPPPPADKTPIARPDSATTSSGSPVKITVLANDEGFGKSPFRVEIVKAPAKGTVSVNNNSDVVTYTPKSGVTGTDSFQYVFFNSSGVRSNQAQVSIIFACPTIHPQENYRAMGDSLTKGRGDNIPGDNVTADGCFRSTGYSPVLIDKLNKAKGRKHIVFNNGVGGHRSLNGVEVVSSLRWKDSMHYLVMYGTNDSNGAATGGAVPAWIFKKNMGIIIDELRIAGKNAYLAKIPPVLGESESGSKYPNLNQGARNKFIQEYNIAIDELVREKGISVKPPDFYSIFKSRPDLYSDNVHFNGKGYQRMAEEWFQKLKAL